MMAEMPLADTGRRIALTLEMIGDGVFIGIEPDRAVGKQNVLVQTDAFGVAAGQQGGTRGRANRRAHEEAREFAALLGHPVDVGRLDFLRAETTQVPVALIIGEDDNDIGLVPDTVGSGFDGALFSCVGVPCRQKARQSDENRQQSRMMGFWFSMIVVGVLLDAGVPLSLIISFRISSASF